MNRSWRSSQRMMGIVGAAGMLTLGGCGSASAGAPPAATSPGTFTPGAKSASTPAPPTPVTLVEASDSLVEAPVVIAQAQGFFQQQGLVPKISLLSGNTALSAMVGGSAQFDADVAGQVITADSKGAPGLAIATLTQGNDNAIVVSNAYAKAHHISAGETLKQRLGALRGAKLGISAPGASSADTLNYMLNWAGVPAQSYHEIALGSGNALMVALKQGSIDAFLWSAPQPQEAVSQGIGSILAEASAIPSLANMAYACLVTTRQYAQAHPTVVHHMAAAIRTAEEFMQDHPRQTQAILAEHFHYPAKVLSASLQVIHYSQSGQISTSSWQDTAQVLAAMGTLSQSAVGQISQDYTTNY